MGTTGVALAPARDGRSATATDAGAGQPLASLARQVRRGRGLGPGRSYLALAGAVLVGVWVVLAFGSALTELNAAQGRAAAVRAETSLLQIRLDQAQRELELVQTDSFLAMQARGYGMGQAGERVFGLAPGAPTPPQITPLGGAPTSAVGRTPLESWLRLLFGGD